MGTHNRQREACFSHFAMHLCMKLLLFPKTPFTLVEMYNKIATAATYNYLRNYRQTPSLFPATLDYFGSFWDLHALWYLHLILRHPCSLILTSHFETSMLSDTYISFWDLPLGRPRRRWEDNIRMDLEEIGINAGNWVDSAQDRNYCIGKPLWMRNWTSGFHKPWS